MNDTRALKQPVRCRAVVRYLARLGMILAALSLPPLAVAFAAGEHAMGWRYLELAVLLVLPELLFRRSPLPRRLQTNESLVIVALLYLLAPVLLAWPLAADGAAPLDVWFEVVSALTTTGLSTLDSVQPRSPAFLFSRAWMQWFGGLGIAVFSLALVLRRSPAARRLLDSSLELDDLDFSSRGFALRTLGVYLVLTLAGLVLLAMLLGPWRGLLYTLSAVSTGGFAPGDASLAEFPDWNRRAAVLGVAALGAVPLLLYYRAWRRGWRVLAGYPEVRALVLLTLGFGLLLTWSLHQALGMPPEEAIGHGLLTALSAQTGTGFFTLAPAEMDSVSQLLLCVPMLIGGGMASTAGGIRLLRLLLLVSLLRWLAARADMPPDAVFRPRLAGHSLESGEVMPALLTILLFVLLVGLSWSIFVTAGSPPIPALFEVVSAVGTVGLSSGLAGPELPAGLKLLLSADMLLGRVEILAFLVLFSQAGCRNTQ